MDGLNPALALILSIRRAIESGESARTGLFHFFLEKNELSIFAKRWWERREQGAEASSLMLAELKSPYRRAIFTLLERGLRGETIHAALLDTEKEVKDACQREMERHLAILPFKMMIPLLLFLFPALMILLLAPLMDLLTDGFLP